MKWRLAAISPAQWQGKTGVTLVQSSANTGSRIAFAALTLAAWIAITLFGAKLIYPHETALDELVTQNIGWQVAFAGVMLVGVILWRRWNDLRFRAPKPGTWKLLWLPGVLIALLLFLAIFLGLPSTGVVLLVAVNSLLVGFSEETMFRGVLYRALRGRLTIWPSILWTSAAFGSVHVLNGFITGGFGSSINQAVIAACSGLLLIAILLRTGSLWAAIIFHALWDWAAFLVILGAKALAEPPAPETMVTAGSQGTLAQTLAPFVMVLPGTLYALWLLRRVHKTPPPGDP